MKLVWLALLLLAGGCNPAGESWAEGKLGAAGARALKDEAASWIEGHSGATAPVEPAQASCPSPRVVLDLYTRGAAPYLEYSRVGKRLSDSSIIHAADDVRCLVLAAHDAQGKKRSFKEWMTVRLVDRAAARAQLVQVAGDDDALVSFLSGLP